MLTHSRPSDDDAAPTGHTHPSLPEPRRWQFEPPPTIAAPSLSRAEAWDAQTAGPPGWDALGFLWRRKLSILAVAALAMAAATAVTVLLPKTFAAASTVIYQGDAPAAVVRDEGREPAFAPDTLSSEVELLTSEQLLAEVVTKLGLEHTTEFAPNQDSFLPPWIGAYLDRFVSRGSSATPPDAATVLTETVDTLRTKLSIAPVGLSRVIRITAKSHDPALAALITNGIARAYVEARADTKEAATRQAHRWIEQRLSTLRDHALETARAYDEYRAKAGAVRGKDGPIAQEQLTQVSNELTQVRQLESTVQLALAQSGNGAGSDLDALTSASGSPLLPKLRDQLASATARQAEMEVNGGSLSPNVVANRALVADLTRSIGAEKARIRRTLESKLAVLQSNEKQLADTLAGTVAKVERSDSSGAQMQALEREATASADIYRSFRLRAEQTDPELSYQPPGVRILSAAVPPVRPASPDKRVILPAALVVSLGLGAAFAFLTETRRRGVVTLRALPRPAGQPPLGMLPLMRRRDRRMIRVWDEAVAQILARMLLPFRGVVPSSILVTSALPREGKTRLAIALATAAHSRGLRVLLIDADLRCRGVSKAAGLSQSDQTLVRLLHGEITAADAGLRHGEWGFSVLPAGICLDSPVNLLASEAWPVALRRLEALFDLVIIDTPPVLAAADAWLLARHADATAIAVESGVTEPAIITEAVERLISTQARVIGLVLTKVDGQSQADTDPADLTMFSPELLNYHRRRLR